MDTLDESVQSLIKIETEIDGEKATFTSEAVTDFFDPPTVEYEENTMKTVLKFFEDKMTVEKSVADYGLSLSIVNKETTYGKLSILGQCGEIGVRTSDYKFRRTSNGFFVKAEYVLLFSADEQHTKILISVQKR